MFLPDLAVLMAFTAATVVLTLTPGPDMTLFISRALIHGRIAGLYAMLGAMSGIVLHTFFAAFGVSALLAASPKGFLMLKALGALYLLWLAIQAIRTGSAFKIETHAATRSHFFNHWLSGLAVNLLNPKIALFFITFLPQFVSAADPFARGKMIFLGFYFIALALIGCSLIVLTAHWLADSLRKNPKVMRFVDWAFAGIFGMFAIRLLLAERN